jgi:hypothetical protein
LIPFESKLYDDVQVNSIEDIGNLYIPELPNEEHIPAADGKLLQHNLLVSKSSSDDFDPYKKELQRYRN